MKVKLTDRMISAMAQDAGNFNMKKAGRTRWSREDYNFAVTVSDRLYNQIEASTKKNQE